MNHPNTEPVCVFHAGSLQEAHMVLDLLVRSGVNARIASDAVESLAGEVPFQLTACPIWAPKDQEELAKKVLAEHKQKDKPAMTPFCYHCGAGLAQQDPTCPECNTELDWTS